MQPITKDDVESNLDNRVFPDFDIQAFNECINESKIRNSPRVNQDDVVERIVTLGKVSRESVFENHWLDVERVFRKAGWTVKHYKPDFNERGSAYFTFT